VQEAHVRNSGDNLDTHESSRHSTTRKTVLTVAVMPAATTPADLEDNPRPSFGFKATISSLKDRSVVNGPPTERDAVRT
jgi:hypothetical protein